jgi:CO/xanthine dehydrogenase Mo-binding subunit
LEAEPSSVSAALDADRALQQAFAEPEQRVEGPLKVTGRARYAADAQLPGLLWAAFTTGPLPHARILSIDTAAAAAMPGVRAVLSGQDMREARFGRMLQDWPVLASDRVRFIGERVAAVAAESPEIAADAALAVEVEYEELPAVFEPDAALAPGAPILHPDASSYAFLGGQRRPVDHPNVQGAVLVQKGEPDIAQAFARADRIFEHTFTSPRQHQGYIEPHATVVWIDADGLVHVVTTNKAPFGFRAQMARTIGVPAERIVVDSAFIGGDFGGKGTSIDEFACYFLAKATGRPVKAVMRYETELQAANPRHATTIRLRSGVDRDGRFVAHTADVVYNGGAYAAGKPGPGLIPGNGAPSLSVYAVPNSRLSFKSVYTNTVPGGHMRAPGEVQMLFASESHVDMIARELGMDPLRFRLLNAVRSGEAGPTGERFRETRAIEVLEAVERECGWTTTALPPDRGRGLAIAVRHVGGGKTAVRYSLTTDGTVDVLTGVPDQGGGSYTLIQRIAAAILSIDRRLIRVRYGTTLDALPDPGSGGSRVTHIVGQAARAGADGMKLRLEELATEMYGWPSGRVRLEDGDFVVGDGAQERVAFQTVAARIAQGESVTVDGTYDAAPHDPHEPGDFNFSAYMAEVQVDRETGRVHVRDVLFVADVGAVLNPLAHQGQLNGGFVFGLGAAMMEELSVQDGRVVTASLGDYKLPNVQDTPRFRTALLPGNGGPGVLGAKMAGEVSNSGVAPAIANAIAAAVGARVTSLPLTAERVLAALNGDA